MTAAAEQDIEVSPARKVFMGVIHYGLLSFAMYASFLHWFALVRHDGQPQVRSSVHRWLCRPGRLPRHPVPPA